MNKYFCIIDKNIMKRQRNYWFSCFIILIEIVFFSNKIIAQQLNSKNYVVGYSKNLFRGFNINDARVAASLMEAAIIKEASRGGTTSSVVLEDPQQTIDLMKQKKIDFLSVTSFEYLQLRDKVNLHPYCAPIARDSVLNRLYLLVRVDSKINSIKDLKGKIISMSSDYDEEFKLSTLWLKVLFWREQINDIRKFISTIKTSDNPSIISSDVFFKKADACILLESEFEVLSELNPQLGKTLKILISSPKLITEIGLYTDNLKNDPDLKNIEKLTYNCHTLTNGKNLLRLLKITRLVPYKSEYLLNAEAIFKEYISYSKKNR
jgi:hypothetical protein